SRRKTERLLWRNEAVLRIHLQRDDFQHRGPDLLQPWPARGPPLHLAPAAGSAKSLEMKKAKTSTRLIVAASELDADMLYATRFFAPDPFIFLKRNGRRTLVLSDLEIDRGRRQAEADEILPYSQFEKEVQGKNRQTPPYEKVLAHFLKKNRVRSAVVPAN